MNTKKTLLWVGLAILLFAVGGRSQEDVLVPWGPLTSAGGGGGSSGGGGSGTVNSGTTPQVAYYATSGTAVSSYSGLEFQTTETVFNQNGLSTLDFRIEGDTEANLFFADASVDRVAIGTSTPQARLDVTGSGNSDVAIYNINQTNGTASSSSTYVFSQSTSSGVYGGMSIYGTSGTQTVGGVTPVLLTNNFVVSTGSSTNLFTLFHNNNSVTARFDLIKTLPSTSTPARFLSLLGSEISFNDDSYDLDFRIEGDNEANLVFVDASTDRFGIRNGTPLSQLDNDGSFGLAVSNVTVAASPVTPGGTQFLFRCDASGGNITFNLPAAAGVERRLYVVKKVDATANTCIIDPSGAETIDGAATRTLTLQNSSVVFQANSTTWSIIASHAAATVL